ncbi:MAG: FapA family protein, partial [Desulfobacterales bacterium]|nr:FapA family protein [Desulfobacterales bacterium]
MTDGPKKKSSIPLIGALALKNQLVTKSELEAALAYCKGVDDTDAALKAYFQSQELISNKNLQRLTLAAKAISIRQKEFKFGAIALAKGFINKSVLDLALEDQESDIKSGQKPRLIGDMMVEAGLLTERQRDYILKLQNRVKKTGPDPAAPLPSEQPQDSATAESGDGTKEKAEEASLMPPESIVGGIQLQLSGDFMAAFLSKTKAFDEDTTTAEIKEALFDRGIVSGLMADDMIDGFIQSTGFKTQSFRVAKGIRPIQGQSAKVEYFFNTDYLKAGGMDANGNIDFRQRGEVPLVEKGTVLAEKTPRVESRWGQNIYGDEVSTDQGEDVPLKFGKGAVLSEDGLKILSAVRGYPKFSLAGVVFVHEEYTTGGDVDFETGHIEFDGNVNVKGCIKSGFKVTGCDVTTVELDGGIVEADGDVKVAGGINEGTIYARGNVYAKFVHKSEIICMGDIHVQKEIVESTIETSGACVIANGKL